MTGQEKENIVKQKSEEQTYLGLKSKIKESEIAEELTLICFCARPPKARDTLKILTEEEKENTDSEDSI